MQLASLAAFSVLNRAAPRQLLPCLLTSLKKALLRSVPFPTPLGPHITSGGQSIVDEEGEDGDEEEK